MCILHRDICAKEMEVKIYYTAHVNIVNYVMMSSIAIWPRQTLKRGFVATTRSLPSEDRCRVQTPPEIKDCNALEVKREQHVGFCKVRGYGVLTAAVGDGGVLQSNHSGKVGSCKVQPLNTPTELASVYFLSASMGAVSSWEDNFSVSIH